MEYVCFAIGNCNCQGNEKSGQALSAHQRLFIKFLGHKKKQNKNKNNILPVEVIVIESEKKIETTNR